MPRIPSVEGSARPIPQPSGSIARIGAGDADSLTAEARVTAQQGGMLMQVGDQLAARQKEFDKEVEREQLRVDTLRAEDAMTKLREKQLALSLGDGGYTKVQGTAALSRPLLKDYGDMFDAEVRGMMGELGNDQQKELFRQRAQVVNLQYREGILRHLATESKQAQKQQLEGTVAVEIKQATANWDKPDEVGFSIERVRAGINRMAEIDGWDGKYTEAKTKEVLGKIHDAVIDQMISSGQLVRAQDWYKANKEDVDVGTAQTIQAKTVDAQQREVFNGLRASFLAVQESPQGLKDLMKSVQGIKDLDEAKRNNLVNQIQSQQNMLERRAQAAQQHADSVATRVANELNTAIYSGREFTQADVPMLQKLAAQSPSQAVRINGLIKLADEMASFRTKGLEEQLAIIQKDALGVRDGSVDARAANARKSSYDASVKLRSDDPPTWAVTQGIWKADSPQAQGLNISQIDKLDPNQLLARYDAVRSMASAPGYAVPFKPLTSVEVREAVVAMQKLRPEQRMGFLSVLAEKSKGDMAGYRALLAQIAPDQPAVAKAAVLAIDANTDRRKAHAADIIAQGQSILEPLSQETGKAGKTALMQQPPETKLRAKFTEDVRNAYSMSPEEHDATFQTIRAAYAALTKDSNTADRTIIDNDAWKKAVDMATGGIHKYKGRETVLPWGMSAGEWEDKAFSQIKSMERAGKLPPGITANRLLDLPVVKISDTKYVFIQDGTQRVDTDKIGPDGKPIPLVIDIAAPIEAGPRPVITPGTSLLKRRAAIADQQKFDQQFGAPK